MGKLLDIPGYKAAYLGTKPIWTKDSSLGTFSIAYKTAKAIVVRARIGEGQKLKQAKTAKIDDQTYNIRRVSVSPNPSTDTDLVYLYFYTTYSGIEDKITLYP